MIRQILARRQDTHYHDHAILLIKNNHVGTDTVNSHRPFELRPKPRHFRIETNQINRVSDLGNIFVRLGQSKICNSKGDNLNKVVVGLS